MAKWQHFVTAAATIAVLSTSTSALADQNERGHHKGCDKHEGGEEDRDFSEKRLDKLAKKLSLSSEQKSQMQALMATHKDQRRAQRKAMHTARMELREAAERGASSDEINRLADSLGDLMAVAAVEKVQGEKALEAILTVEQQQEFSELKEERRAKHDKKKGKKPEKSKS